MCGEMRSMHATTLAAASSIASLRCSMSQPRAELSGLAFRSMRVVSVKMLVTFLMLSASAVSTAFSMIGNKEDRRGETACCNL